MFNSTQPSSMRYGSFHILLLSALITGLTLLSACGGTKVYNNDKTIVYRGEIYNISAVKQIGTEATAKLTDGTTVDITRADKSKIQSLLKENDSIYVSMSFKLDSQEMPYRAGNVNKYRDYSRMKSDFDSAYKKIVKLMGDKKQMQLQLK